jgi:hypothetical protein
MFWPHGTRILVIPLCEKNLLCSFHKTLLKGKSKDKQNICVNWIRGAEMLIV